MGGNTRSYPQMERSCFTVTLDSNKHLEKVTRGGDTSPECQRGRQLGRVWRREDHVCERNQDNTVLDRVTGKSGRWSCYTAWWVQTMEDAGARERTYAPMAYKSLCFPSSPLDPVDLSSSTALWPTPAPAGLQTHMALTHQTSFATWKSTRFTPWRLRAFS